MRTLRTTEKASRRSCIAYGVENEQFEHSHDPLSNVDDDDEFKARTCETTAQKSALDLAEFYSKRRKSANKYLKKITTSRRPCKV